jgi:hypothetical protein
MSIAPIVAYSLNQDESKNGMDGVDQSGKLCWKIYAKLFLKSQEGIFGTCNASVFYGPSGR